MAQHFLDSPALRDFSLSTVFSMSEEQATDFFAEMRWGSKTKQVCPGCGLVESHYLRKARKQWRCKNCDRCFSVTSETPFANHRISLKIILCATFLFISSANGISANELSREIGTRFKTSFILLHKLREALWHKRNLQPMSGMVEVDGGHFGGKPRKPRFRKPPDKDAIVKKITGGRNTSKAPTVPEDPSHITAREKNTRRNHAKRKQNRRVVINIRQIHPQAKKGAARTIIAVARSENEADVVAMIRKYVIAGSTIRTDENAAYSNLSAWYTHETVEHSREFSTIDGVNENQAESYFSRLRRSEYGTFHRFSPIYLAEYANEMAWREDLRRQSQRTKLEDILRKTMRSGYSQWWRGYHQRKIRGSELLTDVKAGETGNL